VRIPSGSTDRYVYFLAVDATDLQTPKTGLSGFTVYRSRNGAAAAAMTTPTVNEVDSSNMPGVYELLLDEDTTIAAGNDSEEMVLHISVSGMKPVVRTVELYRPETTEGRTLGIESDGDLTKVNTLDGHTAQTGDSFARIGAAGASLTALATAAALTTVDGVVDAVKAVTDLLPDAGALTSLAQASVCTEGRLSELDAGNLPTDIVAVGSAVGALENLSQAEAQAAANAALVALHLDHLLGAAYDPASKPGNASALWNAILENDGGVPRYTANALEQAPSGGTNPNVLVDTTIAVVNSQTSFTLTAGSDEDDAYNDQSIVLYDASNSDYPSVRKVTDYVGATKTVTLDSAPDFTILAGDGVKVFVTAPGTTAPTAAEVADAVCDEALAGHTDAGSLGKALADTETDAAAVKAVTDNLPDSGALNDLATLAARLTAARSGYLDELGSANLPADVDTLLTRVTAAVATAAALATVDTEVGQIKAVTDALPDSGALTSLAQASVCTEGRLGELDAANLPADVAAVAFSIAALNDLDASAIEAAVWDAADKFETGWTPAQALRVACAIVAGLLSGGGTATNVFKGLDKSTTRASATVDESGNRTAITYTKGS
jgi:hypothetical protein